jgi:hypothetical protein
VIRAPLTGATPRHVLMLNAWLDESVPNAANEQLAAALGVRAVQLPSSGAPHFQLLPQVTGPVVPGPVAGNLDVGGAKITGAMVEFEQATHEMATMQRYQRTVDLTVDPPRRLPAPVTIDNPIETVLDLAAAFARDVQAGRAPVVDDTP